MLLGVYRSIHNGEREKERIYGQNWEILEHCGATLVALEGILMFVKFLGERRNLKIIDELQLRDHPLAAGPFT